MQLSDAWFQGQITGIWKACVASRNDACLTLTIASSYHLSFSDACGQILNFVTFVP